MMMMRNQRNESDVAKRIGSGDELNVRRKKPFWMRKISISLERQILNGNARLRHKYDLSESLWEYMLTAAA
jgi:hypothetical protein